MDNSLFGQLGMDFDPEAELRAQRQQQLANSLALTKGLGGNNPGVEAAARTGAILGSGLAGVPGLTDKQRQMQNITTLAKQKIDAWSKLNPEASEMQKSLMYSDIMAEVAIQNGRADLGSQILQQTAQQRAASDRQAKELEKLGYETRSLKDAEDARRRGGIKTIWKKGETEPDQGFDARIDPVSGDAITGDGKRIPLGEYTTNEPLSPTQRGIYTSTTSGGGADSGFGPMDPDTLYNAALDTMFDPNRLYTYTTRGKEGQLRKDQINAEKTRIMKDTGLTQADLINLQAKAKSQIKSQTDLVQMQNAFNAYETLARGNGQRFLELARKVNKSGVPVFNSALRLGAVATGDPDAAEMLSVLTTYQFEVARILSSQKPSASPITDSARHEIENIVPANLTVGQAIRVINRINAEFDLRQLGLEQSMKDAQMGIGGWLPGSTATPGNPKQEGFQLPEGWSVEIK